jgi:hypothetical protein
MPVGMTQMFAREIPRALFAQPLADIEMIVGIDVNVVAEVFAPGDRGRQFIRAAIERELEMVVLIDGIEDVPRGIRRINVDAAGGFLEVAGPTEQPLWNEA